MFTVQSRNRFDPCLDSGITAGLPLLAELTQPSSVCALSFPSVPSVIFLGSFTHFQEKKYTLIYIHAHVDQYRHILNYLYSCSSTGLYWLVRIQFHKFYKPMVKT